MSMYRQETEYEAAYFGETGRNPPFNPWRDLRQRLAWNYGDDIARFEKMQDDIARWRGLGERKEMSEKERLSSLGYRVWQGPQTGLWFAAVGPEDTGRFIAGSMRSEDEAWIRCASDRHRTVLSS